MGNPVKYISILLKCAVAGAACCVAFLGQASAGTTLSGSLTADNAFYAYLSTSETSLGTLVSSGNNWGQTYSFAGAALTAGVIYYLNIEVINYGGPYGLLGSLSLSGSDFSFSNGSQTLDTNTTNWQTSLNSNNSNVSPQAWVAATGAASNVYMNGAAAQYLNGQGPWGFHSGIDTASVWIDNGTTTDLYDNGNFTVDYSTTITYNGTAAAPEPASLSMLGLGLIGLAFGRHRARRV